MTKGIARHRRLSRIPENATRGELTPVEGKVTEGFEYKWVQDGKTMRVRVHGPDASAPAGSNAANGWIVRIQEGKKYYDPVTGEFQPPGICGERRVSLRTLERYVQAYRTGGWEALKPSPRADKLASREIPEDILAKAVALKQEQPSRSIRQIIAILELEAIVRPGVIKESTLSKQLRRRGMTRKALMNSDWSHFRRFEAAHRKTCGKVMEL